MPSHGFDFNAFLDVPEPESGLALGLGEMAGRQQLAVRRHCHAANGLTDAGKGAEVLALVDFPGLDHAVAARGDGAFTISQQGHAPNAAPDAADHADLSAGFGVVEM